MTTFTRLERSVMAALAHDLRSQIPDLAAQFAASTPSVRRNTGFGLFSEMIVDRNHPAPASGPTGDLGTVHAMVGTLADPIAFKARVRNGVLLGLFGDSYGQDTRSIDFATVAFDQVFTVREDGQSIPFDIVEPAAPRVETSRYEAQRYAPTAPSPSPAPAARPAPAQRKPEPAKPVSREPVGRPERKERPMATGLLVDIAAASESPAARDAVGALFGSKDAPPLPDLSPAEKTSLIIGLWVAVFAGVAIAVLALELPLIPSAIGGFILGRWLQTPRGLVTVRRGIAAWKAFRAASPG
jgi:hypothetical protein